MNKKYLNKVVNQLVSETNIDYDKERVFAPFISTSPLPLSPFSPLHSNILPFSHLPLPSTFAIHCNTIYGITYHEIDYIWDQYKSIISDKINNSYI